MADPRIVMPDAQEMLRRLSGVDDGPELVSKLYPLIARCAGERKAGAGVAYVVLLAVSEFAAGRPGVQASTQGRTREFVASLIEDKEVLAEANAYLDQLGV